MDGRTVNPMSDPSRKQYPSLHFESYVVPGQENVLPHPVYLPALLASEAQVVGGNEDVLLRIPEIEGFQMRVKANSVTFPDGSRQGILRRQSGDGGQAAHGTARRRIPIRNAGLDDPTRWNAIRSADRGHAAEQPGTARG